MYLRTCKYCGKQFESSTPSKQICSGPHYQICPICGKQFEVDIKNIYRTMCCSDDCKKARRNASIKKVLAGKEAGWNQAKTQYTKKCELCGSVFITSNCRAKYCLGPHYRNCIVCGKEFELTYDQIMNNTQTCSEECRIGSSRMSYMGQECGQAFHEFSKDPVKWLHDNYEDQHPTYFQICSKLNRPHSTVQQCIDRNKCSYLITKYVSIMEQEVTAFIRENIPEVSIQHNDRSVIKPKELDIYIPQLKLAIECNPTYTHNSSIGAHGESPLMPGYHKMKSDKCEQAGIFLFHIFGYEWTHKKPIIQSMICNLLGKNSDRIYARKCEVREVDAKTSYTFLNDNHRQGGAYSKVRLGLYYEDTLVSLMTFGMMRKTIGTGKDNLNDCWELVRFCNKLNTSVVGGASKLFSYFVKHYQPNRIRSFSDRAHTKGGLYSTLGFNEITRSDCNYVWVDVETDRAYHRMNAQKQNIKKFLHDDNVDLSKTEREIMIEHGFVQVYDSGTITWEWTNSCT